MSRRPLFVPLFLAWTACGGGGGGIGDVCGGNDDCDTALQCVNERCLAKCIRAPDCGDGFGCDEHGYCVAGTKHPGEPCGAEWQCATGSTCQIGDTLNDRNQINSTCAKESGSRTEGAECTSTGDCRNGTCVLGHCSDLCTGPRDCATGRSCVDIPHVLLSTATYGACLPAQGSVSWPIHMTSPSDEVLLPIPVGARSVELVMSVSDTGQKVGAQKVFVQNEGVDLYDLPCTVGTDPMCDPNKALDMYFSAAVRHLPAFGQSVLLIPSGRAGSVGPAVYRVTVSSLRPDNSPGSAIPRVTAVVQLSAGSILDLHFHFLDLADHPCAAATDNATLDADAAEHSGYFQTSYLGALHDIFAANGQISVRALSYDDIINQPRLDSLDINDAGELLTLGQSKTGIDVFFVRSLSPVGLQAFGPNPGPAGIPGTRESGIVIGLDTLCYRGWPNLARLTAHEIARYMGLYHNVELENPGVRRDLIDDNEDDPTGNLMHFSELSGAALTHGQFEILTRSPVLQ